MAEGLPKAPAGLKASGRALWKAVLSDYVLDQHELTVLREAARTADTCDALQALVDDEGLTAPSSQGVRAHPALVELRQQRVTFARLLTALRIPAGEVEDGRTQARGGTRGVYALKGVS